MYSRQKKLNTLLVASYYLISMLT